MTDSASFLATFPPIMSAIKVTGNGDGMRIQFDVPESEMAEAVKLFAWRSERMLRLTVEVVEDDGRHKNSGKVHI